MQNSVDSQNPQEGFLSQMNTLHKHTKLSCIAIYEYVEVGTFRGYSAVAKEPALKRKLFLSIHLKCLQ